MRLTRAATLTLALTLPALGGGEAGEASGPGLAIRAAKILTCAVDGPMVVDNGVLLIRDGLIQAVGPALDVAIPEGYEVVDEEGRWLVPGLVDLHCHIAGPELFKGLNDINDGVYLVNPGLRVVPAVIPSHPDLDRGVGGGVTSVLYIPGSATNMGGQGVLLKTGFEKYEDMQLRFPGSLKLAQAGNPERWAIGVGRSFMNWNTRDTIKRGQAYHQRWKKFESGEGPKPERNPQLEIFHELFSKNTQVSVHTQIYQVVLKTVTMLAGEFGLDAYIDHGTFDGYRAAPIAEQEGVPAIIGPREIATTYNFPGRFVIDTDGAIVGCAAEYQKRGHTMVGFNTDSPIVPEEQFSLQAAVATRYGFENDDAQALRGLTIVPAMAAGIDDEVGSLEAGKHADVLVVTGDPADPRTVVERVFIEGRRVYDMSREERRW
jgi:imidazolonepropionase-like amidohydrolase